MVTESLCGAQASSYGQIPVTFIANRGQVHHSVQFIAKGLGLTAYFTPSEVVLDLHRSAVRMRYLGATGSPGIEGLDVQEGQVNYLIGNDPSQWQTNVPLYGRVIYKNLYPGIDMVYSSNMRLLKSEFIVAPGGDPLQIRISYEGVESMRIDDEGGLVLTTSDGEIHEAAPEIYQESSSGRDSVKGAFRVSSNEVWFLVAEYDRNRPLRIDSELSYSTYLGGRQVNQASAIAVDGSGAAYVTGCTKSMDFPVTGGVTRPTSGGGVDAFITKLNSSGSAIVYSTYLGGEKDDCGSSIAVDGSGNAYVTGFTDSTNFPLQSALQAISGGARDAFVAKLNLAGTALIYSTYLGGSGADSGNGIAIDAEGAAYVTGSTSSFNFPVLGAFQTALAGQTDGFVAKLSATGSAIAYSTYLGGSLDDSGSSIAVDSFGAAYVAGNTTSANFPTQSALQASNGGATDAFVTKLSASGGWLIYSSYLGGSGTESVEVGRSIAVDASGGAYITGTTASTNFPVFHPLPAGNNGGGKDAFVVKLSPAGTEFVYSTYLGGSAVDFGQSIAVDGGGNAYVTGYTFSTDLATVSAEKPSNAGGSDVFVAKLNSSGSALMESGFLEGADNDSGRGIAIDSSGNAYVTGQTLSSTIRFRGAIQSSNGAASTGLVAKFTFGSLITVASPVFTPSAGEYSTPQSVAISTTTVGAAVRYTTDGSTPTSNIGTLYSGPVSIDSTTTLKAIAFKSGVAGGDVRAAGYSIASVSAASALFIKTDTTTQGSWKGTYGSDGEVIPQDAANYPSYAKVSLTGSAPFTWLASTTDPRAPQKTAAVDRIASTWYSFSNMSLDVNLADGKSHQVALYCLDWTNSERTERIDILAAGTGKVLDSRAVSAFGGGQYLIWNLTGHVTIRITLTGGPNSVVSGLFFGPAVPAKLAAITNLRVLSITNTQAVIQFTDAANPSACTVEVSESSTYAPLNHDVDPTLFSGSNACNRIGSIVTGSGPYTVTMVLGTRAVQTASNGLNYSRSLQAFTQHFVRVTHGNQATTVASTTNIPNGNTFADALPISALTHEAILPSLPDTAGYTFSDPFTGALLKRIGQDGDTFGGGGGPIAWSGGSNKICSAVMVASGYYCVFPTTGGFSKLYYINTATGDSAFLGLLSYNTGSPAGTLYASSAEGNWDDADASVIYIIDKVGASAKQSIIKLQYSGTQTPVPPGTFTSLTSTDLTPDGTHTLTDLLVAKTVGYAIPYTYSRFPACGLHGLQKAGGHTYVVGNCLRYQQDSPGYAFAVDLGNKLPLGSGGTLSVVAAGPIFANPACRWCGTHSQYYVGDQANTVFVPQSLYGGTATGPYIVTQVGTISATASSITTMGEPAAKDGGIAPDGDPSLQNVAVADILYFQDNGEYAQVTAKPSSRSLTLARGCHFVSGALVCDGTNAGAHTNATIWMACKTFIANNTDTIWWDFLNDTSFADGAGTKVIVDTHQSGHQVTRNFGLGVTNIVEGNGIRIGPAPSQYSQWSTRQDDVSPQFAGINAFSDGNSVAKHPSYDQQNASLIEQGWFTDQWPWGYNGRQGSAALAPGKTNIYKFTLTDGDSFSIYKLPYFGMVGGNALSDISGLGSVLADAANYQLCIANAVNECVTGSAKGDIYVSSATLTDLNCKQGENQPGPSVKDICVQNTSPYVQSVPQLGLLAANQTGTNGDVPIYGAGLSRALTYMIGSYRKADTGGNAHPLPDGTWVTVDARITNSGVSSNMLMVKVSPQPGLDNVDRSTFVPVSVTVTGTHGSTRASINFWYGEYGYENQRCTNRSEKCNVTEPTIQAQPFNFVQTDSWVGQSCSSSCTIMLPLLPNHVMQYQIQYLNANNAVLSSGPVQIVADQFNPGSTNSSYVTLAPASLSLTASQTQQFTATVTGSSNTGASWSISPSVGTISSGGLYAAPAAITTNQNVIVTATSLTDPTKNATAVITLFPKLITPIRINAGGPAYTDTMGRTWAADTGFTGASCFGTGSTNWKILGASPAPAVYQSVRYGDCTFTATVPDGTYTINLMFAEIGLSQAGQRTFNVMLNGQAVLSNFDIVQAAGGPNLPVVKSFTVKVANGQITVQTTMIKYGSIISGIEIVPFLGLPGSTVRFDGF